MKYTVPDYYHEFKCIAADCPATCCAGWQIVIDDKTLKKYMNCRGPFGSRLTNSICWKEKAFEQYSGRCAFLNESNLCDIYLEAGPDMLCRTCKRYPRHIEEFENEREISLSLSCPVVARMLLARQEPVRFLDAEDERQEQEDEDFDVFLYSALQDCRSLMIEILQDRKHPMRFRMAKILALGHDVQNRINSRKIFEIEALLKRYQKPGADVLLQEKFAALSIDSIGRMQKSQALLGLLDRLEVLDDSWTEQTEIYRKLLYDGGASKYEAYRAAAGRLWAEQETDWTETESEQLMVYFLFTYFCGAVYDGNALAQVKMAIVNTLILRELELAAQIGWGLEQSITLEDRARIAWRYSRELEHSDQNLNTMEKLMDQAAPVEFQNLLGLILD